MERAFHFIEYDLAQDLIHYNDQKTDNEDDKVNDKKNNKVSLKDHSLILSTGHFYKDDGIINEICEFMDLFLNSKGPLNSREPLEITDRWREIELKVESKFFENSELVSLAFQLRTKIQETVHFVGMQILEFLKTDQLQVLPWELFLRCLVITSQGTINLKKIIIQLDQSILIETWEKFLLACIFSMNQLIQKHFVELSGMDINNLECFEEHIIENFHLSHWKEYKEIIFDCLPEYLKIIPKSGNPKDFTLTLNNLVMIVFKRAVQKNNYVSVHCLWTDFFFDGFNRKKIFKEIIPLSLKPLHNVNIIMFFLLQLYNSKSENIFKSEIIQIIQFIVAKIRWHSHLVKILDVLKNYFEDCVTFLTVLNILIDSHCNDYPVGIKLDVLKSYFQTMPSWVKKFMVPLHSWGLPSLRYKDLLLNPFMKAKKNVITMLFEPASYTELKNFFLSKHGIEVLQEAIINGKIVFVNNILRSIFQKSDFHDIKNKCMQMEKSSAFIDWWPDSN